MNKNIHIIITSLFLVLSFNYSFADSHREKVEESSKFQKVEIGVSGMTCGSCALDLKKIFSSIPSVKEVDASFSNKNVILTLNPNQSIDDSVINKTIEDLGYSVTSIKR